MNAITNRAYEFLADEELRSCSTIPDEDCTDVPKNFILNIVNGSLTKLAEKLISPNLTLPWILQLLGAPAMLIGMLVPIKDAGSLLPQLFVAGSIRTRPKRKFFWVFAALAQGLCWLIAGVLIFTTDHAYINWLVAILLLCFSLASGIASVAFKDVTGKTIPKGNRGQMLSYRSTFGGILAIAASAILIFFISDTDDKAVFAGLFLLVAALWLVAALVFAFIDEASGSTQGGRNAQHELKAGLALLQKQTDFRNFLLVRALLMAIPLLTPFYVILSGTNDNSIENLGILLIVGSVAQVISSPIWGRFADRSTLFLMKICVAIGLMGVGYALFIATQNLGFYASIPLFLINGLAYAGARLSRKTYLIDYAPEDERPTYVAIANTTIGLFTLMAAGFGFIAQWFGIIPQLLFFGSMLITAGLLTTRLKKV